MSSGCTVLKVAFRAAAWRTTRNAEPVRFRAFVAWCATALAAKVFWQYAEAGTAWSFDPYGLNAAIAWSAVSLTIAACFVRADQRLTALSAMLAFASLLSVLIAALNLLPLSETRIAAEFQAWRQDSAVVAWLAIVAYLVWWFRAQVTILRSFEPMASEAAASRARSNVSVFALPVVSSIPDQPRRRAPRAIAFYGATLAALAIVPHQPIFSDGDVDAKSAGLWEYVRATLRDTATRKSETPERPPIDAARVEFAQPALLDAAVKRLAPQRPGMVDVYAVGVAGWADQDVFVKELDGAMHALARTLPSEGRSLRLANNPATVDEMPIANRQNLAAAIRAVGRVMDKEEDVLLLFMTSHGSPRGIALYFRDLLVRGGLAPEDVRAVLDGEGIRHRIVIVSACHSGGFVRALADDDTVVLTAADEDKTSFGCSNERDWTYFGDAFFNRSLRPDKSLASAFDDAKLLIAAWEARDGLTPSEPRAHFGPALMRRIESLRTPGDAAADEMPPSPSAADGRVGSGP